MSGDKLARLNAALAAGLVYRPWTGRMQQRKPIKGELLDPTSLLFYDTDHAEEPDIEIAEPGSATALDVYRAVRRRLAIDAEVVEPSGLRLIEEGRPASAQGRDDDIVEGASRRT